MWLKTSFVCACLVLAGACGGSSTAAIEPDTDEFDVSPSDQTAIDDAADNGEGAEGTYGYDDASDVLTLTLTTSTFGCGIEAGTLVVNVVELTATTMRWTFEDGDGEVTWTRVDNSTEISIVGIWKTTDPNLFLILSAEGTAQIVGDGEECDDDDRPRNGDNCVEMRMSGASMSLDGDLSDWDAVGQNATLRDDAGDYLGSDDGADLAILKVEYENANLYVLMGLHNAPSTEFQARKSPNGGVYRLTIRGDNGVSFQESVFYDADSSGFTTFGYASEVTMAVGGNGIEFKVDLSAYDGQPGFEHIDMIMVEPMDCGSGACETLDYMDCGYITIP